MRMPNRFLLAIASLLPALAPAAEGRVAPDATPRPAVARIVVEEAGGRAMGSGALVDARGEYGLVVTNWHVVRDATGPIEVLFPSGFRSEARPLKLDQDWDLAALVIWRPPVEPMPLAAAAPRAGDRLTICGYGSGSYREATGACTDYYAPEVGLPHELVELDVEARQGDSGGPILNNRGEIAGVLFGAGQGTTLGSFGGRVGTFLASLSPGIQSPGIKSPAPASEAPAMVAVRQPVTPPSPPVPMPLRTASASAKAVTAPPIGDRYAPNTSTPEPLLHAPQPAANPAWQSKALASTGPRPSAPQASSGDRYSAVSADEGIGRYGELLAEQPAASAPTEQATIQQRLPAQDASFAPPIAATNATEPQPVGPPGWFDEAKTIFAVVGVVFVLLQLIRLVT